MLRLEDLDDLKIYVLELRRGDLPEATIYVDTVTGDILKSEGVALSEGDIGIPMVTRFEDYREFRGVRIPFRGTTSNEASGSTIIRYQIIEVNIDVENDFFLLGQNSED